MIKMMKQYPTTLFLLSITSLVFLAMQFLYMGNASTAPIIYQFGGMYGQALRLDPSQIWRLITPIFVHIGWEHFLFNGITLYFLGQVAESIWGSWKFLAIYILSGIMGNLFTFFLTPDVVAAGASTSIFGLFTALVVAGHFSGNPYLRQLGQTYQALIVINLLFNLFTPGISMVGHLGGIVGGLLCAFFLPNDSSKRAFKPWYAPLSLTLYSFFILALLFNLYY